MRIMFVLKEFPRISETFILNGISGLIDAGHDVTVLSFKKGEKILDDNLVKYHLPHRVTYLKNFGKDGYSNLFKRCVTRVRKILRNEILTPNESKRLLEIINEKKLDNTDNLKRLLRLFAVLEAIKRHEVDHIHSHFADYHVEFVYLAHKITGIPYTLTMHGYDIFFSPPKGIAAWARHSKKVIAESYYNRDYMNQRLGLSRGKIQVIPCGVDLNLFKALPVRKEREFTVLAVGRLHPVKGHDFMIAAAKLLARRRSRFRCLIIGEGAEKEKLKKRIAKCQIEKQVRLLGAVPNHRLPLYYSRAHVLVLSSLSEGSPMVLKESLACGTPVIASDVTGVSEIVKSYENGILVKPRKPKEIAEKIIELMENPKLLARLKNHARASVKKNFDLRKNIKHLESILCANLSHARQSSYMHDKRPA